MNSELRALSIMPASRTRRIFAYFLDNCVLQVACVVIALLIQWAFSLNNPPNPVGLFGLIFGLYKLVCEWIWRKSFGHACLDIMVTYERYSWWRPLLRNSWYFIPFCYSLFISHMDDPDSSELDFLIGLTLLVSTKKRHVFDWLAGARLIQAK
ncbi:RDD family protein [Corynebacterium sp. H128]|uniref:RDD family protein n=1 Tax=Corynebacterium sp. H128 TaxID=3133427 RepID=UPI003099C125